MGNCATSSQIVTWARIITTEYTSDVIAGTFERVCFVYSVYIAYIAYSLNIVLCLRITSLMARAA